MKAAVLYGKEDIRLEEVPDLGIILGDKFNVLVKVKAAGICGTDIHFYNGLYADRVPKHAVLGHELRGEVVAVGDDVRHHNKLYFNSQFKDSKSVKNERII